MEVRLLFDNHWLSDDADLGQKPANNLELNMHFQFRHFYRVFLVALAMCLFSPAVSCFSQTDSPAGQNEKQIQRTLQSFKKLDDHPLFEMRFYGDYVADKPRDVSMLPADGNFSWACSIFVSYGEGNSAVYGRNFDWEHNPALLLHTHPSGGYASISMVDISYLGFERKDEKFNSLEGRRALLKAPMIPFDGMNEHGLTVGMAAVGDSKVPIDSDKPTVGSLQIIRLMLDRAKTVDEALAVFDKFNVVGVGGPRIHYLIADINGNSAVIELLDGKKHVIRNEHNWQSATNFYLTNQRQPLQQCSRFSRIHSQMADHQGSLSVEQTFMLLKNVAQNNTQWSVAYDMQARVAKVAMSRNWNRRFTFKVVADEQADTADDRGK